MTIRKLSIEKAGHSPKICANFSGEIEYLGIRLYSMNLKILRESSFLQPNIKHLGEIVTLCRSASLQFDPLKYSGEISGNIKSMYEGCGGANNISLGPGNFEFRFYKKPIIGNGSKEDILIKGKI